MEQLAIRSSFLQPMLPQKTGRSRLRFFWIRKCTSASAPSPSWPWRMKGSGWNLKTSNWMEHPQSKMIVWKYCPPASEGSREVANFVKSKKLKKHPPTCTLCPKFDCPSLMKLDPKYLRTGRIEWAKPNFRSSLPQSHIHYLVLKETAIMSWSLKNKRRKFSPLSGFKPRCLGTESQCATNELCWPPII